MVKPIPENLGQLFMVGLPEPDLDIETRRLIQVYGMGNFILFQRNIREPLQVARLCHNLKNTCQANGLPPPLISIDQEGGRVARLTPPFAQFPGAAAIAKAADPEKEARRFAEITAKELKLVGCNLNLAPVMDLDIPGTDPVMQGRTLGSDPELVGRLGSIIIETLQKSGVLATAKHFPGIGGVKLDPHQDLPVMATPRSELEKREFVPFHRAIATRVAAIMTAHVIYLDIDPEWPATLSQVLLTDILRDNMGFDGIVITDDLDMGAIERHFSPEESAVQAFGAGSDMLLVCHKKDKAIQAFEAIKDFVEKDPGGRKRFVQSLQRIITIKERYKTSTRNELNEVAIKEYFDRIRPEQTS